MKKFYFLLTGFFLYSFVFSQTIKINEFMASNATIIADEYGEYNDWIELYNYGTDTVNIAGYFITDTIGSNTKHQIPAGYASTKIPPHGYLLLWADNDSLQTGALHLSFKLGAGGEQIGVIAPDGTTIIDSITFGQQITDISYGRYPNGSATWLYFNFPTPGASNSMVSVEENEVSALNSLFYPNPISGNMLHFYQKVCFTLYDIFGNKIAREMNADEFNTSGLARGCYLIITDEGICSRLLIAD